MNFRPSCLLAVITMKIRSLVALPLLLVGSTGALAASFDCTKAKQPSEKLICGIPSISKLDGQMGDLYKKNLSVLSDNAVRWVKDGQKEWLAYWPSLCVNEVGKLDPQSETTIQCVQQEYQTRIKILGRQKPLLDAFVVYPISHYRVMKSTAGVEFVKLAHHTDTHMAIDLDKVSPEQRDVANAINTWLEASDNKDVDGNPDGDDETISDTEVDESFIGSVNPQVLSLQRSTYLYGHGAAHPLSTTFQRHFNLVTRTPLEARQVFQGKEWEEGLSRMVEKGLKKALGDNYSVEKFETLKGMVIQPGYWSFTTKGLNVAFNPYDVAPYAAGAPDVTIPWSALNAWLDPTFSGSLPKQKERNRK